MENKNLLPPGFRDDLSPTTETEHIFMNKIIKIFSSNGYKIIKPPLVEYLKSYENKKSIFCIVDKDKKNSLKIRNDITTQISRIATSRLRKLKRPLRLCYYGEVLRNQTSILRPERQFLQVGAECIGEKSYFADVEILILAFQSLQAVGIKNISVDFSNSIFIKSIVKKDLINSNQKDFLKHLTRKDINMALSFVKNKKKKIFIKNLIECRGNLLKNINLLKKLKINKKFSNEIDDLIKVSKILRKKFPNIIFNVDFIDNKPLNYYSGLNFTVFAKDVRGEIASGGRYINRLQEKESGTGFACYMDTILRASSLFIKQKKIIIPFNTSDKIIKNLYKKNFIIERVLNKNNIIIEIAKKNKCTHALLNNKIKEINYE